MKRPSNAVVAVLINKLAGLHSTGNSDRASLLEILGHELSGCAENGNVEKVGRAIAFLVTVSTIYRNREVAYGSACVGGLELRVASQAANNYDLVQILFSLCLIHCMHFNSSYIEDNVSFKFGGNDLLYCLLLCFANF